MDLEELFLKVSKLVSNGVHSVTRESIGKHGICSDITFNQWHYLEAIGNMEYPTFTTLSEKLGVTKPSTTAIVSKLIKMGYIFKQQSLVDKRVFYLYLTDKAKEILESEKNGMKMFAAKMKENMSSEDMEKIHYVLEKIMKVMGPFFDKEKW
ncbi:MAG: hypothetical protein DKM50_01450 [Candidatus Margulisiibacteriota bacterium]|nr:MAG: hypothetical protein A2X43_08360 [Candidatus Margulisbacteria bacterium GWD2_39_127]OGI01291.1 MAG: hypothetical protein A2X42_06025 [Candidatus Margulisbacteria bacterium GWF2_38_17]OGI09235.1 MAG: hypothetical protein A2X41_01510 [Candidatus Margulisbacteria bacterium GWE2_39_32]PZM83768.1 MAG: hypothetical protein DKM50_01450 [Candidatus Margulisiibacteriota bacterium]HAR63040.1 hypothetical protein [Candidatus Margulisiibacteriota bacterium]